MKTSHRYKKRPGRHPALKAALLIAGLLLASTAWATLPAPTPAQQQAAAAKKAAADAQAAADKAALAASIDAVSGRWRTRAAQEGWKTHPAVAVAAAPAGGAAATAAPAVAGTAGAGNTSAAAQASGTPIKSEKLGTAPPSQDVKTMPTQAQPRSAKPTVDKGTPDVKNK
jgi:hypothetical protein